MEDIINDGIELCVNYLQNCKRFNKNLSKQEESGFDLAIRELKELSHYEKHSKMRETIKKHK